MSRDRSLKGTVGSGDGAVNSGNGSSVRAGQTPGIQDILHALEVYTERHFRRMEALLDESWILEYTLREMDEVGGGGIGMDIDREGKNVNGSQDIDGHVNGDVSASQGE